MIDVLLKESIIIYLLILLEKNIYINIIIYIIYYIYRDDCTIACVDYKNPMNILNIKVNNIKI